MANGIFGSMFDFNGDGEMSALERAAEFQFLHDVVMTGEAEDDSDSADDEDDV